MEEKRMKRMEKVSHVLVVENVSLHHKTMRKGEKIESDEFMVCGKPWTIQFYPFTRSVSIRNESKEAVEFVGEIRTLNRSNAADHGISSFRSRPTYRLIQCLNPGKIVGVQGYISEELVELAEYGYCIGDCLKIRATIGMFVDDHHDPVDVQPPVFDADDFGMELEAKLSDDVCVIFQVASNQRYYAHLSLLVARCPALLPLLPHGDHHQLILLLDMDPNLFEAILWFLYNGALHETDQEAISASYPFNSESFAVGLLAAADRYELQNLKKKCQSLILEKKVSLNSLGNFLYLADACHSSELKSACWKFAAKNKIEYLEEKWPLLFLELSGSKDYPSTDYDPSMSGGGVFCICHTVFSTLKESIGWSLHSPSNKTQKIKND